MSRRETQRQMLTFAAILEARAGTSHVARLRVLANCVDASFGTVDLDLLIRGRRRAPLHPFRQVCPCGVKRNLNPFASGDGKPFPAWEGA